jgi:UDP-glucuronate decarboxylase
MMAFDRNHKDSRILVTGAGFIESHLTGEDCTGPINLGNNSEFTILELAEKVISYTNSRSKLVFKPLPQDDPRQRQPDLSKAKALLNWEPKVALADGLKEPIAYFRRSLDLS